MNDFNELLKQLGNYFKEFCDSPSYESEAPMLPILGAFEYCYEDPDLLFEDDNCPNQIQVFMEALTEAIIHYKGRLQKGGFLK